MDENKTALIKKIGEGNKSLSVIVAEDKLTKFKRFSQSINLSMGYLLNQAIDRYLANNSTEIFNTPTGVPTTIGNNTPSVTVKDGDIEELINTTIEAHLLNKSIGYLSKADIEELINTTIEGKLDKSSIGIAEVENLVNISIDNRITPLTESVTELETYTQSQFKAVRDELKKSLGVGVASPTENRSVTTDTIAKIYTFAEFAKSISFDTSGINTRQPNKNDAQPILDAARAQGIKVEFKGKDKKFVVMECLLDSPI